MPGQPIAGGNRLSPGLQGAELGSGVIIDKEHGYIVTNNHVVRDADRIIGAAWPRARRACPIGRCRPQVGPCRVKVKADSEGGGPVGRFGKARNRRLGAGDRQPAGPRPFRHGRDCVGNRAKRRRILGISSRTSRPTRRSIRAILEDRSSIWRGESSGSIQRSSLKSGGYEGIGLAIPSAMARRVVESLIKEGKVVRGYLGVDHSADRHGTGGQARTSK